MPGSDRVPVCLRGDARPCRPERGRVDCPPGCPASIAVKTGEDGKPYADLAYSRCGAVFYIRLLGVSETGTIDDYAQPSMSAPR